MVVHHQMQSIALVTLHWGGDKDSLRCVLDKRNTKVPLILGTTWLKSDEQILYLMDDEFEHGKTKS